ncbi:hypothetical protein F511_15472 [Dorcoceras hygrometricum]|uniref:Uncharacterized protein n=1 Tax=Dorcoceras hygrometricum TaxID=472368 RepID=A0A2Z7B575_9LAMI|nr:hypothetical protein F511_15472 [Dorcoceras hygrometricum]
MARRQSEVLKDSGIAPRGGGVRMRPLSPYPDRRGGPWDLFPPPPVFSRPRSYVMLPPPFSLPQTPPPSQPLPCAPPPAPALTPPPPL